MTSVDLGYYRSPTIANETVVFVCESDLWSVSTDGGRAQRLTLNQAEAHSPFLSPDGQSIAFVGIEEGSSEVYLMPAAGGVALRLTYLGAPAIVTGWAKDGSRVLFGSKAGQPFNRYYRQWSVAVDTAGVPIPELNPIGPADRIFLGPEGGVVIGRNIGDPARWKRYRGGTAGEIWIDEQGVGEFRRLVHIKGNLANPMWVKDRIFFIADHEGHGNLYSCLPSGGDLRRHTDHEDYYVRNATSDGKRIVYQCGGDLYLFEPQREATRRLDIVTNSAKPQLTRRFAPARRYLEDINLHPKGHSLVVNVRGKLYVMGNWEKAVTQIGQRDGVRYRLPRWLPDGERIVTVSDEGGEEVLEIYRVATGERLARFEGLEIGRPIALCVSPKGGSVALTNESHQLHWIDLEAASSKLIDHSPYARIAGIDISPDGKWLGYGFWGSPHTSHIRVASVATGEHFPVSEPVHVDHDPRFDPEGKYLYFISYRTFNPVMDQMHFEYGFPRGGKPYLVTLQAATPSPFSPEPKPLDGGSATPPAKPSGEAPKEANEDAASNDTTAASDKKTADAGDISIDFEGITARVVSFPVEESIYSTVEPVRGKVFYGTYPIVGRLDTPPHDRPHGVLRTYDFETQREEVFADGISNFTLGLDRKTLVYRAGERLRVVKTSGKPEGGAETTRRSGWIDLSRVRVQVQPKAEWLQMYREAWRLQRDHFWTPDMSQVDWEEVYHRYLPLLQRVATRDEFSDLMWEVQGELGTSHAYEYGGDRPEPPPYRLGRLGADLSLEDGRWRITHIVKGDSWNPRQESPLRAPGANVKVGDILVAIGGVPVNADLHPGELLVNQAGADLALTIEDASTAQTRVVTVATLRDEGPARYREWVESNRKIVHAATNNRVGYVHIPDMSALGFAEFHRYYLQEVDCEALIVDVRYNGGGHVSPLLLEKLARKRLGYDVSRYRQPEPYPADSVAGPIVAITNEHAGSDGDIFSHSFKMMKLGPLIGKRTWGGVIGIWPRHPLVDQTITSQPEFSFWFHDVGWNVENYGTDPDIDVDITPQDWARGRDTQLETAIDVILKRLAESPPRWPDFSERPNRARPKLPPR